MTIVPATYVTEAPRLRRHPYKWDLGDIAFLVTGTGFLVAGASGLSRHDGDKAASIVCLVVGILLFSVEAMRVTYDRCTYREVRPVTHVQFCSYHQLVREVMRRYPLEKRLGQGGYATVYQSKDTVIKVIGERQFNRLSQASYVTHERLPGEMHVAKLPEHPNVLSPTQFAVITHGGDGKITKLPEPSDRIVASFMDHFPNSKTGFDWVCERTVIDVKNVRHLGRQLAEGIAHLHRGDLIHRDIKLDNLLIDEDNHLKLIDYNQVICSISNSPSTPRLGTDGYRAPEIDGDDIDDYDESVDIYSFGRVLYELATNNLLSGGTSRAGYTPQMRERFHKIYGDAYPEIERLIAECLDLRPSKRPAIEAVLSSPFLAGFTAVEVADGGAEESKP